MQTCSRRNANYFNRQFSVQIAGVTVVRTFHVSMGFCLFMLLLSPSGVFSQSPKSDVVRVFILAGQSNMEGKASNKLLEYQASSPGTSEYFAHLRRDGRWIVREDVFIKFLERHGGLTIGYGSPDRTGLELEFGTVVGDHFDEPVLLIKTAWGGHSLYQRFRSPSAGLPSVQKLELELAQAQKRVANNNEKNKRSDPLPTIEEIKQVYGSSYRAMLNEVKVVMSDYEELFPTLRGRRLELAGFVWFQGFNDMFGDGVPDEYEENMKHFVKDVRRDLDSPRLPFVIGMLGQNGSKPATGAMLQIQQAQWAMNSVPEFRGNVKAIQTDELVDKEAERLFPEWQKHRDEWDKVGSDRPYHYLGSAIWFSRIGNAMGEAMLELLPESP